MTATFWSTPLPSASPGRTRFSTAKAKGVGNPIVYLGSKTGRDGIHGASMASAAFEADAEEKRPTVQVGDPFAEKLLLEACLELMASGAVVAIQDMGAAGLTSSAVEMGAKGDLGVELDLDSVPCRETGMSAYEMLLSESQERMLMVLRPEKEAEAEDIFRKWGLDFAVIGKTTDTKRFVVRHGGEVKADLPIKELGDQAPLYDRPWTPTAPSPVIDGAAIVPPMATDAALLKLLHSPDLCSKRWVYEQYDALILGNTIQGPGGGAAVVRLGDGPKGLALTTDCTERYCEADPREGARQAVAEAWRNLIVVGARPLALTDNLNFGNPEKPHAMGQLVGCIQGIGEAARALDFPIVSGNVSLYNETMGAGIPPTPAIGGVGLVDDVAKTVRPAFKAAGEDVLLIGGAPGWLGRSAWLSVVAGREEGAPPPVDLAAERRNGEFVAALIAAGRITAAQDLSDGGLAVALAEMAMAGGIGATRRGGRPGARLLLRRGSGPLCADRHARRNGRHRRGGGAARRSPGAHRRHRRRDPEARRRGAGRACGASRGARRLVSRLYEPRSGEEPDDSIRHRQDQGRLRLSAARTRRRHQRGRCGGLHDPHDRRRDHRRGRARRGRRRAARGRGPRRGRGDPR